MIKRMIKIINSCEEKLESFSQARVLTRDPSPAWTGCILSMLMPHSPL
jgi:hypothetical protein